MEKQLSIQIPLPMLWRQLVLYCCDQGMMLIPELRASLIARAAQFLQLQRLGSVKSSSVQSPGVIHGTLIKHLCNIKGTNTQYQSK